MDVRTRDLLQKAGTNKPSLGWGTTGPAADCHLSGVHSWSFDGDREEETAQGDARAAEANLRGMMASLLSFVL